MSQANIRQCFEARLAAMTPALATSYENDSFTPVTGTPYQKANLLPAEPDNASIGSAYYREQGLFQVTLCYPNGGGAGVADARAELVKTQFKRGTSMTKNGQIVLVVRTPTVSPGYVSGDRWCVPISIYYTSEVFA